MFVTKTINSIVLYYCCEEQTSKMFEHLDVFLFLMIIIDINVYRCQL